MWTCMFRRDCWSKEHESRSLWWMCSFGAGGAEISPGSLRSGSVFWYSDLAGFLLWYFDVRLCTWTAPRRPVSLWWSFLSSRLWFGVLMAANSRITICKFPFRTPGLWTACWITKRGPSGLWQQKEEVTFVVRQSRPRPGITGTIWFTERRTGEFSHLNWTRENLLVWLVDADWTCSLAALIVDDVCAPNNDEK